MSCIVRTDNYIVVVHFQAKAIMFCDELSNTRYKKYFIRERCDCNIIFIRREIFSRIYFHKTFRYFDRKKMSLISQEKRNFDQFLFNNTLCRCTRFNLIERGVYFQLRGSKYNEFERVINKSTIEWEKTCDLSKFFLSV